MKTILLLGVGTLAIASTGCTTIAEMTIVGKPIEDRPMPHKEENYTLVKENGSTIFKLSIKGKTALRRKKEKLNKRKRAVRLGRNWCAPLPELVTGHSHGPPLLSMDSGVPDRT